MKLFYKNFDEKIKTLKEKMEEMVITHELVEQEKLSVPVLEFGNERVEGVKAISEYLEDLHRDMRKGYHCSC